MAESKNELCNVCDAQHVSKQAKHWCPECEEGLCENCLKHHNASKYTKAHTVISMENYTSLPSIVVDVAQNCKEHGKKYQLYCSQHECLCCTTCLSNDHSKCSNVLIVEQLAKNSKSFQLTDMKRRLRNILLNIDKIAEDRKQNIDRITTQNKDIRDEIKAFRNKINIHLDTVENQILTSLDTKDKVIKQTIEKLLVELSHKAKLVQALQDECQKIKPNDVDQKPCQALMANIESKELYVKSLFKGKLLQQHNLRFISNDHVSQILSSIRSLGTITCSESPQTITYQMNENKDAQVCSTVSKQTAKSYDDITLNLSKQLKISKHLTKSIITGCTVNIDGNIILVDNNNRNLVLLNDKGEIKDKISIEPSNPWDAACIDASRIAVTCNGSSASRILQVNIVSMEIERSLKRPNGCFGIAQREGKLFYHASKAGIETLDIDTSKSTHVVKDYTKSFNFKYTAISGDRIYLTKHDQNLVLCYSNTGDKIWEFCNTDIVKGPYGVAVDKNSNVYVVSYTDKSIAVISADGKRGRKLITLNKQMHAIDFDKNGQLFVADCDGDVTVYTI